MVFTSSLIAGQDRRKYDGIMLYFACQLFNPLTKQQLSAKFLNICPLAERRSPMRFNISNMESHSFCYIENFGRFQGRHVVHEDGQHVLEFSI